MKKLEFDKNSKFISGYSDTEIHIMKLGAEKSEKPRTIKINTDDYSKIHHLRLLSNEGKFKYTCYAALQKRNFK